MVHGHGPYEALCQLTILKEKKLLIDPGRIGQHWRKIGNEIISAYHTIWQDRWMLLTTDSDGNVALKSKYTKSNEENQDWTIADSSKPLGVCNPDPCQNHGNCIEDEENDTFMCEGCDAGWTGQKCSDSIDDCLSSPCLNGGDCIDKHMDYECSCTDTWSGVHCENYWCAKYYQGHNYGGWEIVVGETSQLDLTKHRNNDISSFRVNAGCTLRLFDYYKNIWLLGTWTNDVSSLQANNDKVSSLSCTCQDPEVLVSCGSHKVATCEECPQQGDGKCKGDCKTVNHCLSTDSSKDSSPCVDQPEKEDGKCLEYGTVKNGFAKCKWVNQCQSFDPLTGPLAVGLEIQTSCGKYYGTKDDLVFNICQNQQCCSTGPIGLPIGGSNCQKADIYKLSELGDCANFDILWQKIQGSVTFSENIGGKHDGWKGDYFKLIFSDGSATECQLTSPIGFRKSPESLDINCDP